jgi:hypothetical protein
VIDREAKTDTERWDLIDALKERLDMDHAYKGCGTTAAERDGRATPQQLTPRMKPFSNEG